MNDADIEIIISLATGELDGQERIDALAHVNANPLLARELETQISSIDAVQSMPNAEMTTSERSTLHADLIEQLHLEQAPVVAVPVKRKLAWWQPVIGLASAAAVVFAIVVVPNMLSSSGSDDVAFQEASTELSAEFDASGGADEPTTTAAASASVADDAGESGAASEEAPLADAAQGGGEGLDLQLYRIPNERQNEFNDLASDETTSELLAEKLARSGFSLGTTIDPAELQACVESLETELPDGEAIPVGTTENDTVYVSVRDSDGNETILEIDFVSCQLLTPGP